MDLLREFCQNEDPRLRRNSRGSLFLPVALLLIRDFTEPGGVESVRLFRYNRIILYRGEVGRMSVPMEIITFRISATGVWGYDFYRADNRLQVGSVRGLVMPSAQARIESANIHLYSSFDLDTTIIPGTGRRVKDNATGEEVYRLIYWRPGLYQVRSRTDSVDVEIRNGQYLFGIPGNPVTALTERCGGAVPWAPEYRYMDAEPYFRTVFFEDVSEGYAMMALSFPALRFY